MFIVKDTQKPKDEPKVVSIATDGEDVNIYVNDQLVAFFDASDDTLNFITSNKLVGMARYEP
jgi:uncharacterized protein YneR